MKMSPRALALVASLSLAGCSSSSTPSPGGSAGPTGPTGLARTVALRSLQPADVYSGCGTPTIDGVISPGEWDGAVKVRFGALLPESLGGGTIPAEVMSMSDGDNLYVAYRYAADTSTFAQSHVVEIDANHSGAPDDGDDAWLLSWWSYPAPGGTTLFADDFRGPCLVDGVRQSCAPMDTDATGFGAPGTSDGGAVIGFDGTSTTVETWHPYHDGDPRDVQAAAGDTIPMNFSIRLVDQCGDFPRCYGDTYFPDVWVYRPFLLACGAPPHHDGGDGDEEIIEVRIDVKPGDRLPTIHLSAGGVVTVAVLGGVRFQATEVDRGSLWFAGAPVAHDSGGAPWVSTEDVNGDGVIDLVAKFQVSQLQLHPGDLEASLAGLTTAGRRFHGTDAVRVIP